MYRIVEYQCVRNFIQDADLLLWRGLATESKVIKAVTRGMHSHAGKAAWVWNATRDILVTIDMVEHIGGRVAQLSKLVQQYPGIIDVYRPNADNHWPHYSRDASIAWTWQNVPNTPYGSRSALRLYLLRFPLLRYFFQPVFKDDYQSSRKQLICSTACAKADHIGGGVDPVQNLADDYVEPVSLANSLFYTYLFTLTWSFNDDQKILERIGVVDDKTVIRKSCRFGGLQFPAIREFFTA